MTNEEILKFQKRARLVAKKRGYPGLADDFAQELILTFIESPDRGATVDQLFVDYLRKTYGRTGTPGGDARSKAELTLCPLDDARHIAADPGDEREDGGCAFLFGGKQAELYQSYFVDELSEASIGASFGVTESRISQMIKPMKQEIRDYYMLRECAYRLEKGERLEFLVDWIKL